MKYGSPVSGMMIHVNILLKSYYLVWVFLDYCSPCFWIQLFCGKTGNKKAEDPFWICDSLTLVKAERISCLKYTVIQLTV